MKLKPMFDRVVLKEEKKENAHINLFIPKEEEDGLKQARVVAVGDGILPNGNKVEMKVKVGDFVLYSRYGGMQYVEDEETYYIVRQNDILGIIKEWLWLRKF